MQTLHNSWGSILSHNIKAFLWAIFILLTSGLFYQQLSSGLSIETNILKLLPETEVDPFAEEAFSRFSDKNFKQIVVGLKVDKDADIKSLASDLTQSLKQTQRIERFNSQISDEEQQLIAEQIFNHRFHLLSDNDRRLLQEQGAESFVDNTQQLVYSPMSGQLLRLIPDDPLLLSYRYLQQSASQGNLHNSAVKMVNDFPVFTQGNFNILVVSALLTHSPFDNHTQQLVTQSINQFKQNHPKLEVFTTGALFYAEHAASSAKSEISTIGFGSLIGVILLLIIAFRSSAPLILTLTSLAVGIFLAFSVVHFFFGYIHILTLVFGASLVGVAVDYAFHYFASALHNNKPLTHILMAIFMGLTSSVIGYVALYLAPFPGLQQMALFCATGLIGAFLTVILLFDKIHLRLTTPVLFLSLINRHLNISHKLAHPNFILVLLVLPVIAGYLLLTAKHDNDNIRQLQAAPPELIQQEQILSQITSAPATNQFFLVRANDTESLIDKLSQLDSHFLQLVKQGAIDGYSHLAQYVPSKAQQSSDYQLVGEQLTASKLKPLIDIGILDPENIAELRQDYQDSQSHYLELSSWLESPLGQRFSYLSLGQIEGQQAAIISLINIKDMVSLEQLADQTPDLYFLNKVDKISQLFSDYRQLATQMLLLAIILILILLTTRYRLLTAMHIVLAPIVAASLAIIITTFVTGSFNLFSTLALFLVFGIGIDYGLFYAEAKSRSIFIHLAISLSAFTTFLSFGLLSLSETPAIHAFGLTMLIGILTVFFLSPIIGRRIYQFKGL